MGSTDRIKEEFAALVETVARLRGPEGCPWDRKQTHESLKPYVVEETYEVLEAIDSGEPAKLEDELGDLLLQIVLHARIASENGEFDIADVCVRIREKLHRRHPHVFADVQVSGVDDVLHNWEQIKRGEKLNESRKSALDGVPKSLPALMRATELSKKAARTGFDWPEIAAVFDKLREEIAELDEAVAKGDKDAAAAEIGDVLFAVVNIARFEGIDAEGALRDMLERFTQRFAHIEHEAAETGRSIEDMTLQEMDAIWDRAKKGRE